MNEYSFQKGWFQVRQGESAAVRVRLQAALDAFTRQAFRDRLKGMVNHTAEQREAIERIFAEYGITDVWGFV